MQRPEPKERTPQQTQKHEALLAKTPTATEDSTLVLPPAEVKLCRTKRGFGGISARGPGATKGKRQTLKAHTEKKITYLLALYRSDLDTQQKLADHVGVGRQTIAAWDKDPILVKLKTEALLTVGSPDRVHDVWAAVFREATRPQGSVFAMQLYLTRFDPDYQQALMLVRRQNGPVNVNVQNVLTVMENPERITKIREGLARLTVPAGGEAVTSAT